MYDKIAILDAKLLINCLKVVNSDAKHKPICHRIMLLIPCILDCKTLQQSADIVCNRFGSDLIDTANQKLRLSVGSNNDPAPAIDPDWFPIHTHPTISKVVFQLLARHNLLQICFKHLNVFLIYKLSMCIQHMCKLKRRKRKTLHRLL